MRTAIERLGHVFHRGSESNERFGSRRGRIVAALLVIVLGSTTIYAVTATILGVGTIPFFEEFSGPATVTVVDATYAAGEQVPWHYHPGQGYVIVLQGSITNQEPCGSQTTYTAGQAFAEEEGHIHRAVPSTTEPTRILFVSVVRQGAPRTIPVDAPVCIGPPVSAAQCEGDGWTTFTVPRLFRNHGDCVSYTQTGK